MKKAGLFILHGGPCQPELEWLNRKLTQAVPGLPPPGTAIAQTPAQLLEALAAQIKQCELFVVAAEPDRFYAMKAQLLEALGFTARVSADMAALQTQYPEDTLFPSGAVVFVAPEARYNGFAMRCGRQHMLVLPLRMDLLQAMEAKIALYLSRAAGSRVIPMPQVQAAPAMDAPRADSAPALAETGYAYGPISPESIVPLRQDHWQGAANRQAEQLLHRLRGRDISCDLLLPPAWAGAADFLQACGGGVLSPVFLQEKQLRGSDASVLLKRRMRASGCEFCGVFMPPARDGSHAIVALAGPGEYARMRRMDLHGGDDTAVLLAELLTLLSEYRAAAQVGAWRGRAAMGLAALLVGAGLLMGAQRPGGAQAQQVSMEVEQFYARDSICLVAEASEEERIAIQEAVTAEENVISAEIAAAPAQRIGIGVTTESSIFTWIFQGIIDWFRVLFRITL